MPSAILLLILAGILGCALFVLYRSRRVPAGPSPGASLERAQAAERKGDWERALDLYRAALVGEASDVETLHRIAEIESRLGRRDAAVTALREALAYVRVSRLRLEIVFRIAEEEISAGRPDRARRVLAEHAEREPDTKLAGLARRRMDEIDRPSTNRRVISVDGTGTSDLDAAGRPFGHHRLLEEIGRGGMGVVWKAWDCVGRRVVALKILIEDARRSAESVERFLREVRAASRLEHPNIARVHEVGVEEGKYFFTSDFIEGRSLSRLSAEGLGIKESIRIVRAIAGALQHAHERGVLHRDVKPENVLVDRTGRPFLLDFGLAKEIEEGSGLTQSGALMGTPRYMSPEQARGLMKDMTASSDQFSLGVVFYELIGRQPPFEGESLFLLLHAIIHQRPRPLRAIDPSIPAEVERICLRCLEKEPERRFRSMGELEAELALVSDSGRLTSSSDARPRGA